MKKEERRDYYKERIWSIFSPKEYKSISDPEFLTIILNKAEKTYLRYERFYQNSKEIHFLFRLKNLSILSEKAYFTILEIIESFKSQIKQAGLEDRFSQLGTDLEELCICTWKEWYDNQKLVAA